MYYMSFIIITARLPCLSKICRGPWLGPFFLSKFRFYMEKLFKVTVLPYYQLQIYQFFLKTDTMELFFHGYKILSSVRGHLQILFLLTLSWRRLLSYRNQSIDLLCKSMDWFLYDNGLRHERVNIIWSN